MTDRSASPRRALSAAAIALLVLFAIGGTAVGVNAFGAGDEFDQLLAGIDRIVVGPSPTGTPAAVEDPTPMPTPAATPSLAASPSLVADETPPPTPIPTATPTPAPVRQAVDVNLVTKPANYFVSEVTNTMCAASGVQMTLAVLGLADTSVKFQNKLQSQVRTWQSYDDSHNGKWGPTAMSLALDAYGAPGYEVRAYKSRAVALRDAAKALETTHSPVLLLAWWGAHTWVMTGFRADADPATFSDATVTGTYILDPWYPRISSIWGKSDPPGTFQNASEMVRNYVRWKRPEGLYPGRDGMFVAVVPTKPAPTT